MASPLKAKQRRHSNPHLLEKLGPGLAHEIRNPLAGIQAAISVLRQTEKLTPEGAEITAELEQQIQRIDKIIGQFLDLIAALELNVESVSLFDNFQSIRSDELVPDEKIRIPRRLTVKADDTILRRVFLELLANARDHGGGIASIRAFRQEQRVALDVVNNKSIADSVALRLFEPFFSTFKGRSGLGLSIVQRWLKAMGAEIKALPNGKGFRILFKRGR